MVRSIAGEMHCKHKRIMYHEKRSVSKEFFENRISRMKCFLVLFARQVTKNQSCPELSQNVFPFQCVCVCVSVRLQLSPIVW